MPFLLPAATAAKTVFTIGKIVVTVKTLVTIAAIAASIAYTSAQNAKMKRRISTSGIDNGRSIMTRDPVAPRRLIYGQVLVSGTLVFLHTTGANNQTLHLIIAMAGHEVEELGDIYFGDEVVPFDGSGDATGFYAGFAHMGKHLGTSTQNVEASLNADAPSVWTSAHRLRGIAYLYIRLNYSAEKFPNGLPNVRCMVKGKKVFDPRTSTTVWSANAALCAADYLEDATFGKGIARARIRSADLIEAANICDENVVLDDASTEDRYTCHGTIDADQDPDAVILDLAGAMAGHIVDTGGTWTVRAGAHRTPVLSLTDSDLVEGFTVQARQSRRDSFNRVRGVYISPTTNWAAADFPPISNSTYKADDGGIWLDRDVQFNFTTSPATAQRLAKIELERGRQQITCGGVYMLKAMQCMPGDVVEITRASLGWSAKQFSVVSWDFRLIGEGDNLTLGIALELQETAAGVWDWANGEETVVDLAPNTTLPDPFTVAAPTSLTATSDATTTDLQADGGVVPRVRLDWTAPADINVTQGGLIRVEFKPSASSDWRPWSTVRGDAVREFIGAVVIGTAYNFRIRAENNLAVPSSWVTVNLTAAGDTSAPAAPGSLTAITGTGKAVSLDWPDSTEADLGEYEVQRAPSGSGSWATLAEVRASRFVDVDVTIGTAYDYRVRAIDRSENAGSWSATATATPGTVSAGSVDNTAPSDPSAPTLSSSTTYLSGDGTVFAKLVINVPVVPSGGYLINLLYRKNGASGWLIADQRSSGGGTTDIDDLTPGVSYEVAAQAFSAFGVGSNIVAATGSPFGAPNRSTAPTAPTSPSLSANGVSPLYEGGFYLFGSVARWAPCPDSDFSYYEVKATTTDSDAATDYSWAPWGGTAVDAELVDPIVTFYNLTGAAGYVRVRAINRSGVASAWTAFGNANGAMNTGLNFGTASNTVAQGNDSRITGAAQKSANLSDIASPATARANLGVTAANVGVFTASHVVTLAGGASSESFTFNHGLGSIQNYVLVQCVDPAGSVLAFHDYADAGNDANNTVFTVFDPLGGTISAGGRRFTIHFLN